LSIFSDGLVAVEGLRVEEDLVARQRLLVTELNPASICVSLMG